MDDDDVMWAIGMGVLAWLLFGKPCPCDGGGSSTSSGAASSPPASGKPGCSAGGLPLCLG